MNSKIETIHDVLPPNISELAKTQFTLYGKANQGFINENEFHAFVDSFFENDKELVKELTTTGFYGQSHKSGATNGLNFEEFLEVYQDVYLLKHQKVGDDNEPVDMTLEARDLF